MTGSGRRGRGSGHSGASLRNVGNLSASEKKRNRNILEGLVEEEGNGNRFCSDCGAIRPRWASLTIGVFICVRCAGIHRSLGVHISFVRSINLDDWSSEGVRYMKRHGNNRMNAILEHSLRPGLKPDANSPKHVVQAFIHQKYVERQFVDHSAARRKKSSRKSKSKKQDGEGGAGEGRKHKRKEKSSKTERNSKLEAAFGRSTGTSRRRKSSVDVDDDAEDEEREKMRTSSPRKASVRTRRKTSSGDAGDIRLGRLSQIPVPPSDSSDDEGVLPIVHQETTSKTTDDVDLFDTTIMGAFGGFGMSSGPQGTDPTSQPVIGTGEKRSEVFDFLNDSGTPTATSNTEIPEDVLLSNAGHAPGHAPGHAAETKHQYEPDQNNKNEPQSSQWDFLSSLSINESANTNSVPPTTTLPKTSSSLSGENLSKPVPQNNFGIDGPNDILEIPPSRPEILDLFNTAPDVSNQPKPSTAAQFPAQTTNFLGDQNKNSTQQNPSTLPPSKDSIMSLFHHRNNMRHGGTGGYYHPQKTSITSNTQTSSTSSFEFLSQQNNFDDLLNQCDEPKKDRQFHQEPPQSQQQPQQRKPALAKMSPQKRNRGPPTKAMFASVSKPPSSGGANSSFDFGDYMNPNPQSVGFSLY